MGLLVPAHSPHRVWAGHWFLTPDYWPRVEQYASLVGEPSRQPDLLALVERERIRYLVVPRETAERLVPALGSRPVERLRIQGLELLVLAGSG